MIDLAVSGKPHFATVSGEWEEQPINLARHLPFVQVRIGPVTKSDEHYGLILESGDTEVRQGRMEDWSFTLYCLASACKESGEESNRYAHQLADDIKDYLEQHRFEQSSYMIDDIGDFSDRESNAGLPANLRRVIVDGSLWITKTQSKYYRDVLPYVLA